MNPLKLAFWLGLLFCFTFCSHAQSQQFIGTFSNAQGNLVLQLKPEQSDCYGLVQTMGSGFFLKGRIQGNKLTGYVYAQEPLAFTASFANNALVFSASGFADNFYQVSTQHGLNQVDFSALRSQRGDPASGEAYLNPPNTGGQAPTQSPPSKANSPGYRDQELLKLVAGSQIVYYTRTSYVNDNTASSITYVNFCPSGRFSVNTDGSFSVQGNYGGSAHGASRGNRTGTWQIVDHQGSPAVQMRFDDGSTSLNPINKQRLLEGRWRIGNTQYAIQRNKVRC